jgi:RNA polymerase sigma-70 factor (ECF subfamily)
MLRERIPRLAPPAPGAVSRSRAGPSDAALVVAARAHERWACEALFRRYAPMANGMALRLMGRDADLDDLVQDSFASALRSLHRLENPHAFASWFGAIVVRTSCKVLRRRRLARRLGLRHPEAIDVDALVSREAPPDIVAELRAIYAVVEDLPANVRVPLILRRVEETPLDEIAQLMGASLATVKRRVAEGERLLEAAMAQRGRSSVEGSRP